MTILTPHLAARMGALWGATLWCRQRGLPVGPATLLELAQRPLPKPGWMPRP